MEEKVVERDDTIFVCPNCENHLLKDDAIDKMYLRIQPPDQMYHNDDVEKLVELWYCPWCGHYFRVYYKMEKLTLLKEVGG